MIVFKAFLSVLNKCKGPIILFTVILVFFGALNFNNSDSSITYTDVKPDVLIVNEDVNEGITEAFIKYIEDKTNVIKLDNDKLDDALFYRNVNYIIYIKEGFRSDILNKRKPTIEIKSTGDYQASLAQLIVSKYLKLINVYSDYVDDESQLISLVNSTLNMETQVEVTSKLDYSKMNKMTTYFNFMNYSLLAGLVYVISLILSSFKNPNIMKRNIISSMNYRIFNRYLLLSSGILSFALWFIYMILSYVLLGDIIFSEHGLLCVSNSFLFSIVSLVISLLIGNLITNKNAINGIVNVIALGSSFICGAFVPIEFMPTSVINMGKILPSYYYINNNEIIKNIQVVNMDSLMPVFKNMFIMILFIILFVIFTNVVSRKKRKFA